MSKQNSWPFVKKVIRCKLFKNKIGSLRLQNFPDISILKKKITWSKATLLKPCYESQGSWKVCIILLKMFLSKFEKSHNVSHSKKLTKTNGGGVGGLGGAFRTLVRLRETNEINEVDHSC